MVMSQKAGADVVVYSCVPSRYWQLATWDRFTIPKPFATLDFYASEPISLAGMELEVARVRIKEELMRHAME